MVAYGSDHLRRQRKDNPQTPQIDPDLDDSPMGLQDCPVLILAVSGVEIQGGYLEVVEIEGCPSKYRHPAPAHPSALRILRREQAPAAE